MSHPGRQSPALRPTDARRREVDRLLEQINLEVDILPEATLRALAPVLREAEAELVRDLRAVLARTDGAEKWTAQLYRRSLVQVRGALVRAERLGAVTARALVQADEHARDLAQEHLVRELARFSSVFEGTIAPIPLAESATLAEGSAALMTRFQTSARRYAGQVGEDIRKQLAIGMVRGENVGQLVQRLVRLGGPTGLVAQRGWNGDPEAMVEAIGEGMFRRYGYWAERLVRTEVINAYNVHAQAGIRAAAELRPGLMQRWNAAIDRRTCIVCAALDGKTATIGGAFPDGTTAPPAHPQCRCAVVAWHPSWDE